MVDMKYKYLLNGEKELAVTADFIQSLLFLKEKYVEQVAFQKLEEMGWKEREKVMKKVLPSMSFLTPNLERMATRSFWKKFQLMHPGISKEEISKIQARCRKTKLRLREKMIKEVHGVDKRGGLVGNASVLKYRLSTYKDLPNKEMTFVPPIVIKRMPKELLQKVQNLDAKLLLRLRGGGRARVPDARDSNIGYSLAYTVSPGGKHANKKKGGKYVGSVQVNRNIINHDRPTAAQMQLQQEVYDVIGEVIETLYGDSWWYRAAMEKLREIPKNRLIPGGKIPVSHIWYTSNPKVRHVHTDTNTIPPAFVFCPRTVYGGEVCILHPEKGVQFVQLHEGEVLGGSWAQYPHCNDRVLQGLEIDIRRSFVVYLDNRAICEAYRCRTDIINSLLQGGQSSCK